MAVSLRSLTGAGACALALTLAAGATSAAAAASNPSSGAANPTVTGKVIDVGGGWFTVQTNGRQVGVVAALERSATKITNEDTPYVWGGGHGEAGVASIGIKGPGYTGKALGFDCSGSVAAVLAGAGLWPAGAGVPADNGVISELLSEHMIAPGLGSAPTAVTLYDDPGVHIFMNIDGRYFGTSDGGGGGDKAGGAGWLEDSAYDASDPAFKKYHFLPSVLRQRTSYGSDFTFQLPADGLFAATNRNDSISLGNLPASDLISGERVRVSYATQSSGAMAVQSVAVIGGGPGLTVPTSTSTTGTPTTTTGTSTTTTLTTPSTTVTTPGGTPVISVPTPTVATGTTSGSGSGYGYGYGSGYGGAGQNGGSGFGSGQSGVGQSGNTGGAGAGF